MFEAVLGDYNIFDEINNISALYWFWLISGCTELCGVLGPSSEGCDWFSGVKGKHILKNKLSQILEVLNFLQWLIYKRLFI